MLPSSRHFTRPHLTPNLKMCWVCVMSQYSTGAATRRPDLKMQQDGSTSRGIPDARRPRSTPVLRDLYAISSLFTYLSETNVTIVLNRRHSFCGGQFQQPWSTAVSTSTPPTSPRFTARRKRNMQIQSYVCFETSRIEFRRIRNYEYWLIQQDTTRPDTSSSWNTTNMTNLMEELTGGCLIVQSFKGALPFKLQFFLHSKDCCSPKELRKKQQQTWATSPKRVSLVKMRNCFWKWECWFHGENWYPAPLAHPESSHRRASE